MKMKSKRNLTEGSIIRNIWYLSLPTIVTSGLWDLFNIVDMIFVGKLGPTAIAAVSICGIMMGIIFTIAVGITTGSVALIARFFGAKDYETADRVVVQSLVLALTASVIIGIAGFFLAKPMLQILGAGGDVIAFGTQYFKIISIGSFTIFMTFALASALRGAGDPVTPMKALAVATAVNIVLDPLLIFGIWIFPRMGVAGSALATVIARGTGMMILIAVFFRGHSYFHIQMADLGLDIRMLWRIVRIGFFGSLQVLLRNLSMLILVKIVSQFGTNAIAAYGIGMRLRLVTMMPGFGFSQAAAVLVGQNLGAKKPGRAAQSAWITVAFYELIMIAFAALLMGFAPAIVRLFNHTPEVVAMGSQFIRIFSLALIFVGLSLVIGRSFNGAGDTLSPMAITGSALLLFQIPLVILLSRYLNTMGIWYGIALADSVEAVLMGAWFLTGRWKHKRV
jgi:putative MATE family efflux protein